MLKFDFCIVKTGENLPIDDDRALRQIFDTEIFAENGVGGLAESKIYPHSGAIFDRNRPFDANACAV